MYRLWKCALSPLSSVFLVLIVCLLLHLCSLWAKVTACCALGLCYYAWSPGVKCNAELWRQLGRGRALVRLYEKNLDVLARPIVVVSFCDGRISWFDHALQYANNDFRRFGLWACFCQKSPFTSSFRLPLARFVLWKMGGILEYRRGVLIDLLCRRSVGVSVVLNEEIWTRSDGQCVARLRHKGIFGVFLRGNAIIVPAISMGQKGIAFGEAIDAHCLGIVPAPHEVRNVVDLFVKELQRLHVEIAGVPLKLEE